MPSNLIIPHKFDISTYIHMDKDHTWLVSDEDPKTEPHILHMFHPSFHITYYIYIYIDTYRTNETHPWLSRFIYYGIDPLCIVHSYDWHLTWIHNVFIWFPCFTLFIWICSVCLVAIPLLLWVWACLLGWSLYIYDAGSSNFNLRDSSHLKCRYCNAFLPLVFLLTSYIRGNML